ncbi:MAG: hypothetical protein FWF57_07630 [Defluviitaleaceae bacterium]|nr:hypothetical protein [Defluviitaleaceae bacterium]
MFYGLKYNINSFIPALITRNKIELNFIFSGEEEEIDVKKVLKRIKKDDNLKPKPKNIKSILKFWGYNYDEKSNLYTIKLDFEGDKSSKRLDYYLEIGDLENSKKELFLLEHREAFKTGIRLQYLLSCKANIFFMENYSLDKISELISEAMKITYKNYDIFNIKDSLFMPIEVSLLHILALAYEKNNNIEKSENILRTLEKSLIELPFESEYDSYYYIDITISLSKLLILNEKYEESINYLNKLYLFSIRNCSGYKVFVIRHFMGICSYKLDEFKEAEEFFIQAYFGYIMFGLKKEAESLKNEIEKEYSIKINNYFIGNLNINSQKLIDDIVPTNYKFKYIGELLWFFREEKKISIDRLCEGLCNKSTLSRIENGSLEKYDIYLIEALFERLGRDVYNYSSIFFSSKEFKEHIAKNKIINLIDIKNYEVAKDLINNLEQSVNFKSNIGKQFILSCKGLIEDKYESKDNDKKLEILFESIKITIPNFDIENIEDIKNRFLTLNEIRIINGISNKYSAKGETLIAYRILFYLLKNINKNYIDNFMEKRFYTSILFNYAYELVGLEKTERILEIVERGWEMEISNRSFRVLPKFAAIRAFIFFKEEEEESTSYYAMAYFGSLLIDRKDDAQLIKEAIFKKNIFISNIV